MDFLRDPQDCFVAKGLLAMTVKEFFSNLSSGRKSKHGNRNRLYKPPVMEYRKKTFPAPKEAEMRKILMTTDGSENALKAAAYLGDLYGDSLDLEITILSIYPAVPPLYREEGLNPAVRRQFTAWLKKREGDARRFTEEAARVLERGGLKRSQIRTKHAEQAVGVARDIVREMDAQKCEAGVIGKKGLGWFDEYFLGSITGKLLEISEDHPLWVVEGKGFAGRRVFIAMDEVAGSLNLVRYAGRMLRGIAGVEFLFYHFCCPFLEALAPEERKKMSGAEAEIANREKEEMLHCFDEAQNILLDLGFEKKSLRRSFDYDPAAPPQKVVQGVLKEFRAGNYGTLIVGRKGATRAREFRVGSVALRAVAEAENCAVWVV
jgi:nucleotide-binding universal stress UspA family protein